MWVVWYTRLGLRQSAQVNLRIDPVLKAAAEKVAEAEHRSLTNLIEKLLTDYVRKAGYLEAGRRGNQK